MSEDEPLAAIAPAEAGGDQRYSETLLYDFGKYLASLSLLVLGGVLTFAESTALRLPSERFSLTIVLGSVAAAGVSGLVIAGSIVDARAKGKAPSKYLRLSAQFAMLALGIGVGLFVAAWVDR